MVKDVRQSKGKTAAIVLAVLVHLAIFIVLIFGVSWQNIEPPPVQVELWGSPPEQKVAAAPAPPVQEAKPEPKVEEPPPPPPKEEPKPAPPVKEPEPEPEPPKPDLALKEKQEKERKAKEQADKTAKEKEAKEKELQKEKEAKDKARKEQEALAQKQKQEQLAQEQAQQEQQNQLAAAQQAAADKAAAEKAAQQSAINEAVARIRDKIRSNTDVPDGVRVGERLVVKLVLLPTGEVLSAEPVGGSGNKVYNDAVQRGIKRAEPLPLPSDPRLRQQFRSFDLILTHEK